MREPRVYYKLIFAGIFIGVLFLAPTAAAQDSIVKNTQTILLGETVVRVNVYEKKGSRLTFFAPHYNEQTGTKIAREMVGKKGGRLVEIESFDEAGNPSRQLKFSSGGKSYAVDPNRIFTENGRACGGISSELNPAVVSFAGELLKLLLGTGANKLRDGERFLVAVHNNSDARAADKSESAKARDLTAYAFVRYNNGSPISHGAFQEQAEGVYLSNTEDDEDNFIFLSTPEYIGFFAEKGFNVVVQKPASKLRSKNCGVDDGSLSVFSGQLNLPYINIEADAANGGFRQGQMLQAVYELFQKTIKSESKSVVAVGGGGGSESLEPNKQ